MLGNGSSWMEDKEDNDVVSSTWTQPKNSNNEKENHEMGCNSLATFKSMLEVEDDVDNWYNVAADTNHHHHHLLLPTAAVVDSSSSCSPSFTNNLEPCQGLFLGHKQPVSTFLNAFPNNPLDQGFDFGELGFVENQRGGVVLGNFNDLSSNSNNHVGNLSFSSDAQFTATRMLGLPENGVFGFSGVRGFDETCGNAMFMNRSKLLRPLETFPSVGAQPTLFQKRAALRKNLAENGGNLATLCDGSGGGEGNKGKKKMGEENDMKRKFGLVDDFEDGSFDGNYDSDDLVENNNNNASKLEDVGKNGGNSSNANSTVTGGGGGDQKGKKKGMPAKNLMAERRRRKKLNDRLYMLRSVVPKISKMDRASILGDAIEYLKELLQKINDLHNELESTPPSSSSLTATPTTSFHPLTPTPSTLPSRIKDEICPRSLPSPNGQPARVEVRVREGRAVNIHMFCGRRPGLLLSTMRALDNLGLDIQQAVISCFNGFALDIFRAEQCKEQDVHPEQIKAVLLDSAGFHGVL